MTRKLGSIGMGRTARWTVGTIAIVAALGIGGVFAVVVSRDQATLAGLLDEHGFIELRPPSTLFMPGTVVSVVQGNPLKLRTVCLPGEAFGPEAGEGVNWSSSADMDMDRNLGAEFRVGEAGLRQLRADSGIDTVRGLAFRLRNVKVAEMPDTVAIKGIADRSVECQRAIASRKEAGEEVSVVRAVFVADAEYSLTLRAGVDAESQAQATNSLALALQAVVQGDTEKRLVGEQLVWGLDEDSSLVNIGSSLPATGRAGRVREPILRGRGPITELERNVLRPAVIGKEISAAVEVVPMKQRTSMGCWATVYTMMKSWCDGRKWQVRAAVEELGRKYVTYFVEDSGLPGGTEAEFVLDAQMLAEPPANYFLWSYADMLRRYGPLWITMGDGLSSHALVLVGVYGVSLDNTLEAYEESVFVFIDPEDGAYLRMSGLDFARKFEREAAVIVGADGDVDLRWQIIHWSEGQCRPA